MDRRNHFRRQRDLCLAPQPSRRQHGQNDDASIALWLALTLHPTERPNGQDERALSRHRPGRRANAEVCRTLSNLRNEACQYNLARGASRS